MNAPRVSIQCLGNLFVRMLAFSLGDVEQGHAHSFDHTTLLASGRLAVDVEGERTEYEAPCLIPICKGVQHTLIALADGTVAACLHAIHSRDDPADVLDPAAIPAGTPRHLFGIHVLLVGARRQA